MAVSVKWSNKPDAVDPAIMLRLAIGYQRRRVTDLERWVDCVYEPE
jgi:hypothetical protein